MSGGPQRVVALFDPATGSAEGIEAAAALAARLGVPLTVVWLDDERLRALAELPFVRRIVLGAGEAEGMERGAHDAEVRVLAERVRRRLFEAARRHRIAASFETARGDVTANVSATERRGDLLLVEGTSRPLPGGARLPSQARATVARVNRPVMLLPPGANLATGAVTVVREPDDDRTVRVARELAGRLGAAVDEIAADQLARALGRAEGGVVVLAATSRWLQLPGAWERLANARCAAWLVK